MGPTVIQGETWRVGDAFREELIGSNFTVSVSGLPEGRYQLVIGLVEVDLTNAGARVFDITCGDQTIASNLDILAASGGAGNVMFLSNDVQHAEDSINGPLTVNFLGRVGEAKLNSFEIRDSEKQSVVFIRAADLLNVDDTNALIIPVVNGPVIWKDASQPLDARVHDLISRMSLAEKVQQMRNNAPAIPRLGVPAYNYWSECLHGVARSGVATVFPQAIGMAATWDTPLIHQEAHVIAVEARAKNNAYRQSHNDNTAQYYGLHFWTPNINIFRDPRWGRGQETYGEDPFLTGQLGVSFITGLQGDDPKYLEAYACAKHYAVHSGPEPLRHKFDVSPPERDLYETYLPQFEAAVRDGHVGGMMGAYNSVEGQPACANEFLLTQLLRNQWGFDGYVTSDCGAIFDIWANHKYVNTPAEAAAVAVKAGDDLCCGTDYDALVRAVHEGLITTGDIDEALGWLLRTRFRLGMFDPSAMVPYAQIAASENNTAAHEIVAVRVARESMVLLKNDGVLPLNRKKIKRIAVIGANADSVGVLLGNYNGTPSNPWTILNGIRDITPDPTSRWILKKVATSPLAPTRIPGWTRTSPTQSMPPRKPMSSSMSAASTPTLKAKKCASIWMDSTVATAHASNFPPYRKICSRRCRPPANRWCLSIAAAVPWPCRGRMNISTPSCRRGIPAKKADAPWPKLSLATTTPPDACPSPSIVLPPTCRTLKIIP